MEIERKYEVLLMPEHLESYEYKKIEQGYLCNNPIIRIRKSNDDYILTYKSKNGIDNSNTGKLIMNHEVELPLTKEAYHSLKKKIDANIIYKTRYLIPIQNGLTVELDIFEQILEGLIYAEVEFPDVKTADEFIPPSWLGKNLSGDKRFSNHNLSKITNIKELFEER